MEVKAPTKFMAVCLLPNYKGKEAIKLLTINRANEWGYEIVFEGTNKECLDKQSELFEKL